MRKIVLAAVLAAASCASAPDESVFYYQGTYVPGSAIISPEGGFVARTAYLDSGEFEMAKKAALHRLRKAGEARGYTFVTIGEPRIAEPFGHQLVIEGTLHMAADAPENAVSLASIDGEKVEPPTRPAPARTAKRKPAKVAAPPVDEKPTVIMATEPPPAEADEPVVIMAPVD